jgi:hypothetical protein
MPTRLFTDEENERLHSWPPGLGRDESIRFSTLGSDEPGVDRRHHLWRGQPVGIR